MNKSWKHSLQNYTTSEREQLHLHPASSVRYKLCTVPSKYIVLKLKAIQFQSSLLKLKDGIWLIWFCKKLLNQILPKND